jgi:hypothetical protein
LPAASDRSAFEDLTKIHDLGHVHTRPMQNQRSGRVALAVRARGLLTDDGERIERFELVRPLRAEYLTSGQLAESNWQPVGRSSSRSLAGRN